MMGSEYGVPPLGGRVWYDAAGLNVLHPPQNAGTPPAKAGSPNSESEGSICRSSTIDAWAFALIILFATTAQSLAAGDDIPPLRPPLVSLPPTFWEMCRAQVFEVIVVAVGLTAWLIARRWRPKIIVIVPPEILARRELAALRGRSEDGTLAVEVSRVLRRFCVGALRLPPGELTTSEVWRALNVCPWVTPEIATEVDDFLRRCDERKFSPTPPAAPLNAVETALKLVERLDGRRREKQLSGGSQPPLIGIKS